MVQELHSAAAVAERSGRAGRYTEAERQYRALADRATRTLGPHDPETLMMRHQHAHWTGESGNPEAAIELFARLSADQETHQGAGHPHTHLARHQLAHWYGRAGRPEEAVRRYEAMRQTAETEGRTEAALDLQCNVGHWQLESGDTAAALRTFTEMLRGAEQKLGPAHRITGIARSYYARLAGSLPLGQEGGHDGLRDLREAARAIEETGDLRRALRMYGQLADTSEQLYGAGSEQALDARVAQAKAAVGAEEFATASRVFQQVLDCLELRGQGPGTTEYDILSAQRDGLAARAAETVLRIGEEASRALAQDVVSAPVTAFGLVTGGSGTGVATVVTGLAEQTGGRGPQAVPFQRWQLLLKQLADQGHDVLALYFARPAPEPTAEDADLCGRLGLPAVCVRARDGEHVEAQAFSFGSAGPVAVTLQVVAGQEPQDRPPAPAVPPSVTVFDDGAVALGGWRQAPRARASRVADDPPAFGSYEVLQRIGKGGFGRVYLCRDADGILVAVKTLHAEYAADADIREGFAHEVQAARRVREERFTVPVIAADTAGDTPWMAVPYVSAPSLQEFVQRFGALDEPTVRRVGADIATALTAIHEAGIVHLDLKPANVLMTEDRPRVIDFGIAQIERLTEPREGFQGTYAYASPEQLRGDARFTPASDVFSLGTLLARLALGRLPWGSDAPAVVESIRTNTPDLSGLPAGLDRVVRDCLHPDPARRPTPAEVAAQLLPEAAESGPLDAPPLSAQARALIREHATLPVTLRHETLAYTRSETERTAVADAEDAETATALATPIDEAEDRAEGSREAALDIEARVLAWEQEGGSRSTEQTRRECGEFRAEARARLGGRHPLTLRLSVSYALLGCAEPGGVDRAERAVAEAARLLGEGHPTVRDARALLGLLDSGRTG
ncbi:protein kinase domain-containing protein [Streptomyces sp. NY05-11A]|uniref:protein kinase domain-containing protein n=1 Tax=Streptomyces soliscabiei TaxID=588897 RepID=UPI0029BBFE0D|nr:protein kinase [Streptomyces sp. NY05-11A]MDX2678322.1 protein kinase [Streptomyces sp. NY05-11A]